MNAYIILCRHAYLHGWLTRACVRPDKLFLDLDCLLRPVTKYSQSAQEFQSSVPGIDKVLFVLFVPLLLWTNSMLCCFLENRTLSTFEISVALNQVTGGLDVLNKLILILN